LPASWLLNEEGGGTKFSERGDPCDFWWKGNGARRRCIVTAILLSRYKPFTETAAILTLHPGHPTVFTAIYLFLCDDNAALSQ